MTYETSHILEIHKTQKVAKRTVETIKEEEVTSDTNTVQDNRTQNANDNSFVNDTETDQSQEVRKRKIESTEEEITNHMSTVEEKETKNDIDSVQGTEPSSGTHRILSREIMVVQWLCVLCLK